MAFAVKQGRIKASPVDSELIPVSGNAKKEQRVLSAEQARAFLTVCEGTKYGALFAAMLWTGCRPGELAGLQWKDVDLDRGILAIRRALVRTRPTAKARGAGTSFELAPTKTRKDRTIPIPADLVRLLRSHKAAHNAYRLAAGAEYEDHGLVFCGEFGRPLYLDLVAGRYFKPLLAVAAAHMLGRTLPALPVPSRSKAYAAAREAREAAERDTMIAADFPDLSLYSLRHSMATLLLESGVHAKIVADRLGHATTATTLQVYSHVTPHIQQQAVTALEESLGTRSRSA
jgi:integrase